MVKVTEKIWNHKIWVIKKFTLRSLNKVFSYLGPFLGEDFKNQKCCQLWISFAKYPSSRFRLSFSRGQRYTRTMFSANLKAGFVLITYEMKWKMCHAWIFWWIKILEILWWGEILNRKHSIISDPKSTVDNFWWFLKRLALYQNIV